MRLMVSDGRFSDLDAEWSQTGLTKPNSGCWVAAGERSNWKTEATSLLRK